MGTESDSLVIQPNVFHGEYTLRVKYCRYFFR